MSKYINTEAGWVSPVEIFTKEVHNNFRDQVDDKIQQLIEMEIGVKIDREELIKAMNYDREQYGKGYQNGYEKRDEEIVRCEDCKHWMTVVMNPASGLCKWHSKFGTVTTKHNDFCSYGEREEG